MSARSVIANRSTCCAAVAGFALRAIFVNLPSIFHGSAEVARHLRHSEPHQRVSDPRHFEGIFRQRHDASIAASSPIGRSLADYADAIGGAA